ncbi:response regulator transcription factor [Rhodocaloribacter litoris]|uniref:response regulator transcription factor n=1 Tax=Rhodocaloribacter litoris TaxID=2558931 RepID=UPI00141E9C48|nr:response regulator transcription factor [Rhodocaloribacter litoris]
MATPQILFVEDDVELRELVAGRLRETGYEVVTAATGPAALACVEEQVPDLVLLDIMLPELDGLEVCRRLRAAHPLLYIIMLTARSDELDRVVGLEVGADDYVTKPFSLQELVARVRAALRRIRLTEEHTAPMEVQDEEAPLTFDELHIDPVRREVRVDGEPVHLTVREFDLLLFLARHPDRPFTRMQLLDKVWDIQYEGYDRTVDSHVQRLRAKIERDPSNPRFVRTVWGVGYKFQSEQEEE